MKYVVAFSKHGLIRFVSHLDLMRIFKRALRRTGVVLAYSSGFNPHPRMGITEPLGLGYEGDEEYFEFQTDGQILDKELIKDLDKSLPEGITPFDLGIVAEGQKKLAASIKVLKYNILLPYCLAPSDVESAIKELMDSDRLEIEKLDKKKRTVTIDIKPSIKKIVVDEQKGRSCFKMDLDPMEAGGRTPEYFIKLIFSRLGTEYSRDKVRITREKLILPVDYEIKWL